MLKTALVTPMPSAKATTARLVTNRERTSVRAANRTSCASRNMSTTLQRPLTVLGPLALTSGPMWTARYRSAWFSRNVQIGGHMRRVVPVLIAFCACAPALLTAQLTTPTDWKWRQDSPAPLAAGHEDGAWVVGLRPDAPGVARHDRTRRAPLPGRQGDIGGNFSLEAEVFLFAGESADEYGVFLGGQDIEASASPDYSAFVLRRDGQAAVLRRGAGQTTPLCGLAAPRGDRSGQGRRRAGQERAQDRRRPGHRHAVGEWREGR